MTSYSTGAEWSFPDDLPGGWVNVKKEHDKDTPASTHPQEGTYQGQRPPSPSSYSSPFEQSSESAEADTASQQQRPRQRHYPPRQCRICLDTVQPTFDTPEGLSASLPASFQPTPRVTYASPPGDGGRLLRPCNCKGSQKYVHEECLSAWRMQDPLQKRNYWQCPTCQYKYKLQRLTWGSWISSTAAQVGLTLVIFLTAIFVLGFVADPIINLYLDPLEAIATRGGPTGSLIYEDEAPSWAEHFVKGLASLGLLGFAKFILTLSPLNWFNMRGTGVYVGGRGNTGRERINQLSWIAIVVGIVTFLFAVWKGVRAWSRRTLEKAGERVMDVPGGDDADEDND